jgi:hypothetical protein
MPASAARPNPPRPLIGWLPHSTNPVYAGARIRCLTPLRLLQARGVPVELFNPAHEARYTVLVVQGLRCRPVAGDPATGDGLLDLVARLKRNGCRIAVEDCDNHFYNPQRLPEWTAIAQRLRTLVGLADHLVASTDAMAEVFRRETGTTLPVSIIGDAVEGARDLDNAPAWRRALGWRRKVDRARYLALRAAVAADRMRGRGQLVWFGSHGSTYAEGGMRDLANIRDVLERLNARRPLSLTVISNSRARYEQVVRPFGIPTRYLDWTRSTFLDAMRLHDVAVIPVTRTPFTVCKSNNRLLLALSCGVAVCADGIGSYAEFADVCELDNWEHGIERYLTDPGCAAGHVDRARLKIRDRWTAEHIADQWQLMLESQSVLSAAHLAARAFASPAAHPIQAVQHR